MKMQNMFFFFFLVFPDVSILRLHICNLIIHRLQIFLCLQIWIEWVLGAVDCKIATRGVYTPMLVLLQRAC